LLSPSRFEHTREPQRSKETVDPVDRPALTPAATKPDKTCESAGCNVKEPQNSTPYRQQKKKKSGRPEPLRFSGGGRR